MLESKLTKVQLLINKKQKRKNSYIPGILNPMDPLEKTVYLIGCVKNKTKEKNKARNLYLGHNFKFRLEYAEWHKPDKIYILSAKYGLVSLDQELEPYDRTLNNLSQKERNKWAKKVFEDLKTLFNIEKTRFVFLAGIPYYQDLEMLLPHVELPTRNLNQGFQAAFYKMHRENPDRFSHKIQN